jgi:hypothetical protein
LKEKGGKLFIRSAFLVLLFIVVVVVVVVVIVIVVVIVVVRLFLGFLLELLS